MKVGLICCVSKRPVGFAAIVCLDHRSQADFQRVACRQEFVGDEGIQFKTIGKATDAGLRWHRGLKGLFLLAISREAVSCPLTGGRKIEFAV